jgi:hypothetical protein
MQNIILIVQQFNFSIYIYIYIYMNDPVSNSLSVN